VSKTKFKNECIMRWSSGGSTHSFRKLTYVTKCLQISFHTFVTSFSTKQPSKLQCVKQSPWKIVNRPTLLLPPQKRAMCLRQCCDCERNPYTYIGDVCTVPMVCSLYVVSLLHSSFLSKEAAPATTR
jgi:hypothetical protein